MRRAAILFVFLLTACAQGRAEERAIEHALGLGFVSPTADCDGELASLPGRLFCNVQESDEGAEQRGVLIACPSGLADGPCVSVGANGSVGQGGGKI